MAAKRKRDRRPSQAHITEHVVRRDYEEALRSIGGQLDEDRLEDAVILEVEHGFVVNGLRRRPASSDGEAGGEVYEYVQTELQDADVIAASARGQARRGSGRHAGRYEEALRLIGRHVNLERGARVLLIDQGDGFLLRTFASAAQDMPSRYATFQTSQLDRMRQEALAARTRTGHRPLPRPRHGGTDSQDEEPRELPPLALLPDIGRSMTSRTTSS